MSDVVVVTGGAGGIGAATARRLVSDGFQVVLVDRRSPAEVAASIAELGAVADAVELDVCDVGEVDDLLRRTDERFGGLRGLVLCHGMGGRIAPLSEYTDHEIDDLLDVNLRSAIVTLRSAAALMSAHGTGRIVAVASAAGKEGNPGAAVYSATKAGLLGLVKSLAREVAGSGVLVNAVTPGPTDTPMLQMGPDLIDYVLPRTPLGRLAQPDEVAAAIAWLLSDDCSFTTGSALDVSGGRSAY